MGVRGGFVWMEVQGEVLNALCKSVLAFGFYSRTLYMGHRTHADEE